MVGGKTMKRVYEKPVIEMETFTPNEYIATCYALVDATDSSNFTVVSAYPTDGENTSNNGRYYWNNKGFGDDNCDILDKETWGEKCSQTGWYYSGKGMTLKEDVAAWQANGEGRWGNKTLQPYQATRILNPIEITAANSSAYGTSANAS
jgi:hypothetical protein